MKKLVAATAVGLVAMHCAAAPVDFVTEENPPLNFTRGGAVAGTGTEVLRAALGRAHVEGRFTIMPWSQAYAKAQASTQTCVYSTVRTPEREKSFRWIGPVTQGVYSVYGLDGFADNVTKVDDLRVYRVGVARDARLTFLRNLKFDRVVEVEDDAAVPRMLTIDRQKEGGVDLWMGHAFGAIDKAREQGVAVKVVFASVMTQPYWLACHPAFPKDVAAKLDAAFSAMRADGSFQRLSDPDPMR
jgi:polar amino acid transport system substrate-binding protein